ncbi:MAG: acetyl-CoA carboxylase, carboxyltransferase subunit beta [Alkalispirochaeta sp.]
MNRSVVLRRILRRFLPDKIHSRRRVPRFDDRKFVAAKHACPSCNRPVEEQQLALNLFVCPHCGHHYRISAVERIRTLLDGGEMGEISGDVTPMNPIDFPGYEEKLDEAREITGVDEAITTGVGRIEGRQAVFAIMSFTFLGGSMGSVVGERVARAIMYAADREMPCIIFTASGGARMQEGIFSLMQMAKTSHAAALLAEAGQPLFVVLTDPTTGGVTASFSMLGDVTLAEPNALIGFAGPRVIEGTIRQKLPQGFQRAEFQQEKGFVDMVVPRTELRSVLAYLIDTHTIGGDR